MHKIELKRLARGFLVYGIGGILQKFMGLLLLPLFTRVLTPEDYGALALVGFVAVAVSGFFSLGTGNSMGLLYFREECAERRVTVIWSNATLMLTNGVLLAGTLCLAAEAISMLVFETDIYADLLRLSFVSLALANVMDPFLAYLRMEDKSTKYVALTLASVPLGVGLNAWFVLGLHWGIMGAALAGLVSTTVSVLAVGWVVARRLPLRIDVALFRPLIRIGFPSIFGLFAFLLIDYADRQMLQRMAGLEALGVYSVGYNFGMVMLLFVGAFGTAWPPFFMSFINRRDEARILFDKVFRYYLLIFGALLVGFFAAAKPLVVLLAGERFQETYVVVGMVAAAYMMKGCYLIFLPGLYFEKKLVMQSMIEWVAALVNVALNLIWIPMFGIVGAAAATLVGYVVLPLCTWALGRQFLSVQYNWHAISSLTSILLIACASLWTASLQSSLALVLTSSMVITAISILLLYYLGLEAGERQGVMRIIKTLLLPRANA